MRKYSVDSESGESTATGSGGSFLPVPIAIVKEKKEMGSKDKSNKKKSFREQLASRKPQAKVPDSKKKMDKMLDKAEKKGSKKEKRAVVAKDADLPKTMRKGPVQSQTEKDKDSQLMGPSQMGAEMFGKIPKRDLFAAILRAGQLANLESKETVKDAVAEADSLIRELDGRNVEGKYEVHYSIWGVGPDRNAYHWADDLDDSDDVNPGWTEFEDNRSVYTSIDETLSQLELAKQKGLGEGGVEAQIIVDVIEREPTEEEADEQETEDEEQQSG